MRGRGLKDESDPTHGSVSDAITALYHPEAAAGNKAKGAPTSKPPKTRSRGGKAATTGSSAAATRSGGRSAVKNQDLAKLQPELTDGYQRLNTRVRREFDDRGGLSAYITLRPLYAHSPHLKGAAPVEWLNLLDFSYTFCGFKLAGLHPSVTARLDKIQEACNKLVPSVRAAGAPVKFEGAFQPRKTTDKDTLSDHALGLALHLNYPSDPYLGRLTKSGNASAAIIASIVAQAGQADFWHSVPKKKGESREAHIVRAYQTLASASDAVAAYFSALDDGTLSPEETAKRTKEYEIVKAANSGGDPKLRDPKRGFYAHTAGGAGGNDPMLELVKLLTLGAELQWGGEYNSRPFDLHHFALKKP